MELLVIRWEGQTLKFSNCSANNLLVYYKLEWPSWVGIHKYQYVGHVSIEPLAKYINYQFFLPDYGNHTTHAA